MIPPAQIQGKVRVTPGDIIHVNAGTYTEVTQSKLAVGVSIEGVGVTSIIKSHISTAGTFTILDSSTSQGTAGNQHISGIKMDGDALTGWAAIRIYQRSNVQVYNCTFVDFQIYGVGFWGFPATAGGGATPPTTYATGNEFHDNIITNCSGVTNPGNRSSATFQYALGVDGQEGMQIYNNTLTQTSRALGYNGFLIKGVMGYNRGVKIYKNTLNRGDQGDFTLSWDFAIELWDCRGGVEIYNNQIKGGIDIGGYNTVKELSYTYSVYIHNNTIGQDSVHVSEQYLGVDLEQNVLDVNMDSNLIQNVSTGILFAQNGGSKTVSNINIRRNVITNLGITLANGNGFGIDWNADASSNTVNNINIFNNVISGHVGSNLTMYGINLPDIGAAKNISIRNNIVKGFSMYPVRGVGGSGISIDTLSIENNIFYLNGNSNLPSYSGLTPTHNTTQNNLTSDPLFVAFGTDFHLQATSPAIDAGIYVGLPFNGSAPDIGAYEYDQPPTANAGADQSITLPTSTVSLTGSGTDPDGSIAAYFWTKISGGAGTITNATSSATTVTGLVQGVYKFELKVTDNNGATGRDTMQVTVNAAGNQSPTANAGADQSITLPTNTVSLSGSGTDPDGVGVVGYAWTKISGPSAYNVVNANSPLTDVTGLVQGVYQFQLTATDNGGANRYLIVVQVTVSLPLQLTKPPLPMQVPIRPLHWPVTGKFFGGKWK